MTTHKRKCVCGHMLDVEEVYQLGIRDALGKNLLKDCESCKASMIPQIRAEVIAEISREMRMLFGNEYEKKIRADAIDECIKTLAESEDTILSDRQYYTLIELKEQK